MERKGNGNEMKEKEIMCLYLLNIYNYIWW